MQTANEWTETLKAGRRAVIRPIRRDDVERNKRFLDELSPASKHFLFLGGVVRLTDDALRKLVDPDSAKEMAFVGFDAGSQSPSRQVGLCRYAETFAPLDRLRARARREAPLFDGLDREHPDAQARAGCGL